MKKNILVIGAGAVGGITAAHLSQKNLDVSLLVKYPELKKLAKKRGLNITGHHGSFNSKVDTFLPSDLLSESFEIVFLATKANDMADAAKHILPFIEKDSMVVSMQNGIVEEDLADIVGLHRTVSCIVGWGATMHEPGSYEMTSGGINVIGSLNGIPEEKISRLKNILENIAPTHISSNMYGDLYSKLIINSCISAMGAISGLKLGEMLRNKKIRNTFLEIMKEALKVADAMGVKVEPYANKIDYYKFTKTGALSEMKQHFLMQLTGIKYRKLKSSSLQSIERGKKTEIDYLNGFIVNQAEKYNIDAGVNKSLVKIIKEIEAGKRKVGMHNFKDIISEKNSKVSSF